MRAISSAVPASDSQWTHARHLHFSFLFRFFCSPSLAQRRWLRTTHAPPIHPTRFDAASFCHSSCCSLSTRNAAVSAVCHMHLCTSRHKFVYEQQLRAIRGGTQSCFIARGAYLSLYLIITIKLSLRLHVFHSRSFVFPLPAFCSEIKFSLFEVQQLFIMPKLYCRQPHIEIHSLHVRQSWLLAFFFSFILHCWRSASVQRSALKCKRNFAVSKFSENVPCSTAIPHVRPFSFPLSSTSKFKYVCNFSLDTLCEIIIISSGSPTKLSTLFCASTSTLSRTFSVFFFLLLDSPVKCETLYGMLTQSNGAATACKIAPNVKGAGESCERWALIVDACGVDSLFSQRFSSHRFKHSR